MKKLLFTILALAAVSGAFARRHGGRCGSRGSCKTACAPKCEPVQSCMPAPPVGGCLPCAVSSQSCAKTSVTCEAWAVVDAEQPIEAITTTNTCYRKLGCPIVTAECLERSKIRVAPEQDGFSGGCK